MKETRTSYELFYPLLYNGEMGCYESWNTGWVRCPKEDHYRPTPWASHSPRQTERTQAFKGKDDGAQTHLDEKWGIPMVGVKKKESGVEGGGKHSEQLLFSSANC